MPSTVYRSASTAMSGKEEDSAVLGACAATLDACPDTTELREDLATHDGGSKGVAVLEHVLILTWMG